VITYLVVLDRTVPPQRLRYGLLDLVSQRKPDALVLLQTLRRFPGETEEEAHEATSLSLESTRSLLTAMGLPVTDATIGDALPKKAIVAAMSSSEHAYEGIVLISKTSGLQRWLRFAVSRQLERRYDVPVFFIELESSEKARPLTAGAREAK
jgi:hypothetical protein